MGFKHFCSVLVYHCFEMDPDLAIQAAQKKLDAALLAKQEAAETEAEDVEIQAVRHAEAAAPESPYLFAIVLCKESADALRQRTTARFASNVYCHHITLLFFRTDWRRDSFHCDPLASADWKTLGARVGSTATIVALLNKERYDDKVQAVPVVFADASLRTHRAPHVTISGRAKQASWLWEENEGEPDVKSNDDVVELRGTIVLKRQEAL